jgi:hypothetical protein
MRFDAISGVAEFMVREGRGFCLHCKVACFLNRSVHSMSAIAIH